MAWYAGVNVVERRKAVRERGELRTSDVTAMASRIIDVLGLTSNVRIGKIFDVAVAEANTDPQAQADDPEISLLAEFVLFLRENKAWWIVPIVLALALIGVAIWMSSATLAPFIYPTF